MLDLDEIKDIFIHFEEDGYDVEISDKSYVNSSDSIIKNLPEYLASRRTNDKISISESYTINLSCKRSIVNFDEWCKIQTNLGTALKRIKRYGFNVFEFMTVGKINILLVSDPVIELKNIGDLNQIRKNINLLNLGRIDYLFTDNRLKIKFYKMTTRSIDVYKNILKEYFIIKDLTRDGQIINRKGEISGDQQNGYIFELEPKNIDIYV